MNTDKSSLSTLRAAKHAVFRIRGIGQVVTVFSALVLLCIIFGVLNSNFARSANVKNLLQQIAPILIIGIGQSFVLITAGIDLSIGSVVGMSGMTAATLLTRTGMPAVAVVIITLCAACLIGFINGALIAQANLPPFIATLGTMIIARGIAQFVNGGYNTDGITHQGFLDFFYYKEIFGIGSSVWISLALVLVFGFILSYTTMGRHTYALGSNREAARLSGVNVVAVEIRVYVFSSFLAGVGGLVFIGQTSTGFMDAGTTYELNAVAASVLGGVSTLGGQGLLAGTVVGSAILGIMRNGLTFAGAPLAIQNIATGSVVILAVLLDRFTRSRSYGSVIKLLCLPFKAKPERQKQIKRSKK